MCPNDYSNFNVFGELPDSSIAVAKQFLVCLCLDTSYSMLDNNKIGKLNNCVKNFIETNVKDPYNASSLNICIVTYGGDKAKVIQEFTNVKKIDYKDLSPSGATAMGDGVKLALDKIMAERAFYKKMGVQMHKPILLIMSDGRSTDDIDEALEYEKNLLDQHKVSVSCIGIGIENDKEAIEELKLFSPKDKDIIMINDFEMDRLFRELSMSITGVSRELTGACDDVYLS